METSSASHSKYRLVVFQEPAEIEPVRIMLARELAIHPLDALRLVAHMPGILPGLYDAGQCKRILDALFEFKLPAEARSLETFPDLSRPKLVHEFTLTPGGLNICDVIRKQTLNFLPWDQIGMIAAAKLELPDTVSEYYAPGLVAGAVRGVRRVLGGGALNRKERIVSSPIAPKGEAIIWRKRPHGVFRLSEDKLRYDIICQHHGAIELLVASSGDIPTQIGRSAGCNCEITCGLNIADVDTVRIADRNIRSAGRDFPKIIGYI